MPAVPERYRPAFRAVEALSSEDRYLGAIVFGSVALGTEGDHSDLDVHVVVDEDNACRNINRPSVGGVRLDVTFRSLAQIERQSLEEIAKGTRPPRIAGGIVVFDRTGRLSDLVTAAEAVGPARREPREAPFDRFMLQHADDKVRQSRATDPAASLYSMHACIGDVLGVHYQANARFKVSSKKLLADLEEWDAALAALLRQFVAAAGAAEKFRLWTAIVDRVSEPFGGRATLRDVRCECPTCLADLAALEAVAEKDNGAHRFPDAPRSGDIAWTR